MDLKKLVLDIKVSMESTQEYFQEWQGYWKTILQTFFFIE